MSSTNTGSVHAITQTLTRPKDNSTQEVATMASVFDLRFLEKKIPEAKTMPPKATAFRNLAPTAGSIPVRPMMASSVGNRGGHCV